MTEPTDRLWQSMTTVDARQLARLDPVVLLPLAAVEQHGPHLPLSTDLEIGLGILAHALSVLPADRLVKVLPAQPIGASLEHERFPGTISLESDVLAHVIFAQGASVARSGAKRLVVFNSHGGNRHVLEQAGLRLRHEFGMLVVLANYFEFERPADLELPDAEWQHGLHGGAVETAMMMYLKPELVRTGELERRRSFSEDLEGKLRHIGAATSVPFSWLAGDLHESGAAGDATLASAELGQRLVEHYGRVLAEVIGDAAAFPLERLA
jgi:creatinine amidohydrolase